MDEDKQLVATLSKKDNDTWKFLFDHTSEYFSNVLVIVNQVLEI